LFGGRVPVISLRYLRQSESSAGRPHGTYWDSYLASNTSLAGLYNSALLWERRFEGFWDRERY
jgi:hypothetical protein